jgi:hypothetical protein
MRIFIGFLDLLDLVFIYQLWKDFENGIPLGKALMGFVLFIVLIAMFIVMTSWLIASGRGRQRGGNNEAH